MDSWQSGSIYHSENPNSDNHSKFHSSLQRSLYQNRQEPSCGLVLQPFIKFTTFQFCYENCEILHTIFRHCWRGTWSHLFHFSVGFSTPGPVGAVS